VSGGASGEVSGGASGEATGAPPSLFRHSRAGLVVLPRFPLGSREFTRQIDQQMGQSKQAEHLASGPNWCRAPSCVLPLDAD